MVNTDFELITLRDDATPQRDGTVTREKVAQFYLGKFGPFTERFPLEAWSDIALRDRVDALRRQLDALHR